MAETEPQALEIPGRKGFNEGIGSHHESVQERLTSGCLQVQGDTALVRMKVPEKQTLFRIDLLLIKRPAIACRVPRWRFDLDDIGSQISQYFGAQDAWRSAQIKDSITAQCAIAQCAIAQCAIAQCAIAQCARSVVTPSLHGSISPSSPLVS